MKRSSWAIVPFVIVTAGCASTGTNAPQSCPNMMMGHAMMNMQRADANGDGFLSKDEFMKFHESVFERMKNKDGVIDIKAMQQHRAEMWNMMGGGMMEGCQNMPGNPPR